MLDREGVKKIFDNEKIDAVIHFAGLKAVGESVHKPIEYYHNNMTGTLILCDEMRNHGVKNIIFSSSATVYGNPAQIPDHRGVPEGNPDQPIRLDKKYARAGSDRHPHCRSGMECYPASLLQPDRSA